MSRLAFQRGLLMQKARLGAAFSTSIYSSSIERPFVREGWLSAGPWEQGVSRGRGGCCRASKAASFFFFNGESGGPSRSGQLRFAPSPPVGPLMFRVWGC